MALEIERKFLVNLNKLPGLGVGLRIEQGYIATEGKEVVRVRVSGDQGFLTLKGPVEGFSCLECEYEIPLTEAQEIIDKLCGVRTIKKTRFKVQYKGKIWEIDVFDGDNKGLVLAEIELDSEDEIFDLPDWVSEEVTGDVRYFNVELMENPFKTFKEG